MQVIWFYLISCIYIRYVNDNADFVAELLNTIIVDSGYPIASYSCYSLVDTAKYVSKDNLKDN